MDMSTEDKDKVKRIKDKVKSRINLLFTFHFLSFYLFGMFGVFIGKRESPTENTEGTEKNKSKSILVL